MSETATASVEVLDVTMLPGPERLLGIAQIPAVALPEDLETAIAQAVLERVGGRVILPVSSGNEVG